MKNGSSGSKTTGSSESTPDSREKTEGQIGEERKVVLVLSACSLGRIASRSLLTFASFFLLGFAAKALFLGFVPQKKPLVPGKTADAPARTPALPTPRPDSSVPLASELDPYLNKEPALERLEDVAEPDTRLVSTETTETTEAEDCLRSGRNMAEAGRWEKAIEAFERSLQLADEGSDGHRAALMALGEAERRTGRLKTAAERYSQALALWDDPEARASLEAIQEELESPAETPTPPIESQTSLQSLLSSRQTLSAREQEALDWLVRSQELGTKDRWDEAIQAAERSIQLATEGTELHREALLFLGASEWSSGRRSAARKTFKKVSESWGDQWVEDVMERPGILFGKTDQ